MQYWDNILYPKFIAGIRGSFYATVSQDFLDEECYYLATRAVAAFKFPRISLNYETFYGIRNPETGVIEETNALTEGAIPRGYFLEDLGVAEINIIVAWMKTYWFENLMSNADSYEFIYTDSQIKTFSQANMMDKAIKMFESAKANARELASDYSRSKDYLSTMGTINE